MPDSTGIIDDVLAGYGDEMDNFGSSVDDTNESLGGTAEKLKEIEGQLASFDKLNVIQQPTDNASGGSGGGGAGGGFGGIDSRLLDALNNMNYKFQEADMLANKIRDRLLEWADILGDKINDNIFEPIQNSWDKYGESIFDNFSSGFNNLKILALDFIDTWSLNWKPNFQAITDLFFSLLDTASLVFDTITDFMLDVWNKGGKDLYNSLNELGRSFVKLATKINDEFVKPVVKWFKNNLSDGISDAIGVCLKIVSGLADLLADFVNFLSQKGNPTLKIFIGIWATWKITKTISQFSDLTEGITNFNEPMGKVNALSTVLSGNFGLLGRGASSLLTFMQKLLTKGFSEAIKLFPKLNDLWTSSVGIVNKYSSGIGGALTKMSSFTSGIPSLSTGLGKIGSALSSASFGPWAIGIGVAVTAIVGLISYLGHLQKEVSATDQVQEMFNQKFKDSKAIAENVETSYSKIADETLPKLAESWESMSAKLSQYSFTNNQESLKGLIDETKTYVETAKTAITDYYGELYQNAMTYYANSSVLNEEQKQKNLEGLALAQQEELNKITEHQQGLLDLMNILEEKGELNAQEQLQYQEHLNALNQIAIDTITPEQARQLGEQQAFLARKGELDAQEREKFLLSLQESEQSQLDTINTRYGQEIANTDNKYRILMEKASGNKSALKELEENKSKELAEIDSRYNGLIETNTTEHYNKLIEGLTGHKASEIAKYQKYKTDLNDLEIAINATTDENAKKDLKNQKKNIEEKLERLGITSSDIKKINEAMSEDGAEEYNKMWKKQVEETKTGTKNVTKKIEEHAITYKTIGNTSGSNYSTGVSQGISSNAYLAGDASYAVGVMMNRRFKESLEIKSPSRVAKKTARWFPLGIAKGIESEADKPVQSINDMVDNIIDSASGVSNTLLELGENSMLDLSKGFNANLGLSTLNLDVKTKFSTASNILERFVEAININIDKLLNTPFTMKSFAFESIPNTNDYFIGEKPNNYINKVVKNGKTPLEDTNKLKTILKEAVKEGIDESEKGDIYIENNNIVDKEVVGKTVEKYDKAYFMKTGKKKFNK